MFSYYSVEIWSKMKIPLQLTEESFVHLAELYVIDVVNTAIWWFLNIRLVCIFSFLSITERAM